MIEALYDNIIRKKLSSEEKYWHNSYLRDIARYYLCPLGQVFLSTLLVRARNRRDRGSGLWARVQGGVDVGPRRNAGLSKHRQD